MRRTLIGGFVLLLSLAAPARSADIRVVKHTSAEVYAEASAQAPSYVTNRLKRLDAVEVVAERPDGWLEIKPPAHSKSWINTRFLRDRFPGTSNRVVENHEHDPVSVPVFPTRADGDDPDADLPRGQGVRLARGQQVTVTGRSRTDRHGTWLEIEAPEKEPRFVRADSLERTGSGDGVQLTGGPANAAKLQPSTAPSANVVPESELLRLQAVDADLRNDRAGAVRLYDRLASRYAATEPKLAADSKRRSDYLRSMLENDATPQTAAVTLGSRQVQATTTANQGRGDPTSRSYRGTLMHGYGQIDGQRTYLLQFHQKAEWMSYITVVAGPGVNLEAVVNRSVEVSGPVTYSSRYVMQAVRAQLTGQD